MIPAALYLRYKNRQQQQHPVEQGTAVESTDVGPATPPPAAAADQHSVHAAAAAAYAAADTDTLGSDMSHTASPPAAADPPGSSSSSDADEEDEEAMEVSPAMNRSLGARFRQLAGSVGRSVGSAAAIIADRDLRVRASHLVTEQAGQRLAALQTGARGEAEALGQTFNSGLGFVQQGPRQIQAVLGRLQRRIEESRLQAQLQAERDEPVDVQIGPQLVEDAPQELRSRLWLAMEADLSMCRQYEGGQVLPSCGTFAATSSGTQATQADGTRRGQGSCEPGSAQAAGAAATDDAAGRRAPEPNTLDPMAASLAALQQAHLDGSSEALLQPPSAGTGSAAAQQPPQAPAAGPEQPAAQPAGSLPRPDDARRASSLAAAAAARRACNAAGQRPGATWTKHRHAAPPAADAAAAPGAGAQIASTLASTAEGELAGVPPATPERRREAAAASGSSGGQAQRQEDQDAATPCVAWSIPLVDRAAERVPALSAAQPAERNGAAEQAPAAAPAAQPAAALQQPASPAASRASDSWEMVQGSSSLYDFNPNSSLPSIGGGGGGSGSSALRQGSEVSHDGESYSQTLMTAIMAVPWPVSAEYPEGSRYNLLLQISVGQEEVDEVIGRDINRTFPEHPQFGYEQGQQALFRVLKAYSLHDLEVGYCQGMAFVAGIILMYLPEEPAYRVFQRLLDASGVGLRQLYLPGLQGLKQQLRMLEWLMERIMPRLKAHLADNNAPPVLYASQWFLTAFACPFPAAFACRLLDVMLTENSADVMLRAAMAVLAECEGDLMKLDDFEDLITYLKVEPVRWTPEHSRRVLSGAVATRTPLVGRDMIRAAALAVHQGYDGSMARRTQSMTEVAAAASAAAASGAVAAGLPGSQPGSPARPSVPSSAFQAEADSGRAAAPAAGDGGQATQQQAVMEADSAAMQLALDVLWQGSAGSGQYAAPLAEASADQMSTQQSAQVEGPPSNA